MANYKNIAIIGRRNSAHVFEQMLKLADQLSSIGFVPYVDLSVGAELGDCNYRTGFLRDWINEIDLAISLGGDGTMLSVGREIVNHNVPIIGINQGTLGFMTDISVNDMAKVISEMLLEHKYIEESRTLLSAQIIRAGVCVHQSLALNDIVLSRGSIGNMIEFEMSINNEFVHVQKSDGVIFSTPTGSTAYSLSAGGPILHPHSQVFSIVPICPQSMSNRPIVISDNAIIELTINTDNPTILHYDGQQFYNLHHGDKIIISKAKYPVRLLHPLDYNYYHTLRTKLDWSKRVS